MLCPLSELLALFVTLSISNPLELLCKKSGIFKQCSFCCICKGCNWAHLLIFYVSRSRYFTALALREFSQQERINPVPSPMAPKDLLCNVSPPGVVKKMTNLPCESFKFM